MTAKREVIEVGEYVDAFRTWAFVHPRLGDEERAAIDAGCAYLTSTFTGEEPIERLCRYLVRWSTEHDSYVMDLLRTEVAHSSLLTRLVYAGEPLRMQRCPIHHGVWSGMFETCPVSCNFEAQLTGWLPRLPAAAPSTEDVRAQLLRACDAAYQVGVPRGARAGMFAAVTAVRDQPLDRDPRLWLWRVREGLDALRATLDDPRDEDGWALGGVATIRNLVEDARRTLLG